MAPDDTLGTKHTCARTPLQRPGARGKRQFCRLGTPFLVKAAPPTLRQTCWSPFAESARRTPPVRPRSGSSTGDTPVPTGKPSPSSVAAPVPGAPSEFRLQAATALPSPETGATPRHGGASSPSSWSSLALPLSSMSSPPHSRTNKPWPLRTERTGKPEDFEDQEDAAKIATSEHWGRM